MQRNYSHRRTLLYNLIAFSISCICISDFKSSDIEKSATSLGKLTWFIFLMNSLFHIVLLYVDTLDVSGSNPARSSYVRICEMFVKIPMKGCMRSFLAILGRWEVLRQFIACDDGILRFVSNCFIWTKIYRQPDAWDWSSQPK